MEEMKEIKAEQYWQAEQEYLSLSDVEGDPKDGVAPDDLSHAWESYNEAWEEFSRLFPSEEEAQDYYKKLTE